MNPLGSIETFSEVTIAGDPLVFSCVMKELNLRLSDKRFYVGFEIGMDFVHNIQSKKAEKRSLCIGLFEENEKNWPASL